MTGVRLPGSSRRPIAAPTDEPTRASLLPAAQIEALVLEALRDGPLRTWELRDRLRLNEARLFRHLQAMRDAGAVKVLGRGTTKRKWALKSWEPPFMRATPLLGVVEPKHEAPTVSWWIEAQEGTTQAEFYERAHARNRGMLAQVKWRQTGNVNFK